MKRREKERERRDYRGVARKAKTDRLTDFFSC